jgi:hypothetical protein
LGKKETDDLFSVEDILENLDKEQKRIKIRFEKENLGRALLLLKDYLKM